MVHRQSVGLCQGARRVRRPIGQNQGIQFPIAKAYASTRAAELMVKEATRKYEAGSIAAPRPTWPRCWRRCLLGSGHACIQTMAGFGFAEEYDVERKFARPGSIRWRRLEPTSCYRYREHVLGMPRSY